MPVYRKDKDEIDYISKIRTKRPNIKIEEQNVKRRLLLGFTWNIIFIENHKFASVPFISLYYIFSKAYHSLIAAPPVHLV